MDENEQSEVKPVSIQRIEANRLNALKSTGPKTPQGKANVRLNALKHGFLSKQIVISSKAIGEDPKEFEALLGNLQQHYQPADMGEELQVEIIAVCLWRERRALRCELGEIGRARDTGSEGNQTSLEDQGGTLSTLRQAEREMKEEGEFSPETKNYMSLFGWRAPHTDDPRELGRWQEETLRKIREQIRNFENMGEDGDETDEGAVSDCYAIPDAAALNRILKYQALSGRRLQRALTQLERLQRRRQGDYVPPPVKVSVDGPLGGE